MSAPPAAAPASGQPDPPAVPARPVPDGLTATSSAETVPLDDRKRTAGFLRRHAIDTRALRHTPYRRLFIGNAVANFGYQLTAVAVPVQMYGLTRSSLWVGLIGVAALVPLVFFGVWGGAVSDAVDRRRLLLVSSLLMWAATLGLLGHALLGTGRPAILLVLVALQSVAFAISAPTRQSIIPRLIPAGELPAANTLNATMFTAAMVAGPLCAGVLLVRAGVAAAYLVDAVAFTVALWATYALPAMPPAARKGAQAGEPAGGRVAGARRIAGWREVREGFAYIMTSPVLLLSFGIDIAAMVLALPRSLFPEVAQQRFGDGAIGWLYAAIGIGSVLAGVTSGWIGRVRRQGVALVAAVVGWGVAVALAGLAGSLWLAVLLLAVAGAADLVSAVYRQTILQTYAPDGFQGRLQGIFIAVVAGGPRLGDLRAGVTAAFAGPTVSWVGGGFAAAVVAIILAVAFPALLRYPPRTSTS
jgi:MFS family permease